MSICVEKVWNIFFFFFLKNWSFRSIRPLFLGWDHVEPFEAALKLQFGPSTHWSPLKSTIWRKILECFPRKPLIVFRWRKTWTSWMTWWWVNTFFYTGSKLIIWVLTYERHSVTEFLGNAPLGIYNYILWQKIKQAVEISLYLLCEHHISQSQIDVFVAAMVHHWL